VSVFSCCAARSLHVAIRWRGRTVGDAVIAYALPD
jgi:hypothetical protein